MADKDSNLGVCQTLKAVALGVVEFKTQVYCRKQKACWEHPEGELAIPLGVGGLGKRGWGAIRRGFMAEGVPGLASKARHVKREEKKNFRRGTSLGKGEGTSEP